MSELKNFIKNLEKQVDKYEASFDEELGQVVEVKDGVIKVTGIADCMSKELLEFENGVKGIAFNLEEIEIGVIVLGDYKEIRQGMKVRRTKEIVSIPVGEDFLGRIISATGDPLDGKGSIDSSRFANIEKIAPGVMERAPVQTPLLTGITVIDGLIPIGRGQRQLIIGDRQVGKTTVGVETILNQKGQNVICIYVAIGQKKSKIANLVSTLNKNDALEYTTVVLAGASDPSSMLYLAPYTGVTLAEYFADKGKDVLIIYDDLTKHANAYREMSLLLRRPAGREAYPGDVFYLHSRLLERAVKLNDANGGGSITALPIIETQQGDLSTYIPTNVISITDGQIFLESSLFFKGIRPAINIGASVSRVGSNAQSKPIKKVAGRLKLELAQFRELEAFAQLSADLDPETKKKIDRGNRIVETLKQGLNDRLDTSQQTILIYAVTNGYLDETENKDIQNVRKSFMKYLNEYGVALMKKINDGEWSEKEQEECKFLCEEFFKPKE